MVHQHKTATREQKKEQHKASFGREPGEIL
jgi:hypothetical protein